MTYSTALTAAILNSIRPASTTQAVQPAAPIQLMVGQTINATVQQVVDNTVLLNIAGRTITAKTEVPLLPNQQVTLNISQAGPEQITMRLLTPGGSSTSGQLVATPPTVTYNLQTMLNSWGMEADAVNLTLANALFTYGQTVNPEDIQAARLAWQALPNPATDDLQALAYLQTNQLPMSAESVALAKTWLAGLPPIAEQLTSLQQTMDSALAQLQQSGTDNPTLKTLADVLQSTTTQIANWPITAQTPAPEIAARLAGLVVNLGTPPEAELARQPAITITAPNQAPAAASAPFTPVETTPATMPAPNAAATPNPAAPGVVPPANTPGTLAPAAAIAAPVNQPVAADQPAPVNPGASTALPAGNAGAPVNTAPIPAGPPVPTAPAPTAAPANPTTPGNVAVPSANTPPLPAEASVNQPVATGQPATSPHIIHAREASPFTATAPTAPLSPHHRPSTESAPANSLPAPATSRQEAEPGNPLRQLASVVSDALENTQLDPATTQSLRQLSDQLHTLSKDLGAIQLSNLGQTVNTGAEQAYLFPIPLQTPDGPRTAQLKVYRQPGKEKVDPDNVHLAILLDMPSLGEIAVDMTVFKKQITGRILSGQAETETLVKTGLSELSESLNALGFSVHSLVADRIKPKNETPAETSVATNRPVSFTQIDFSA